MIFQPNGLVTNWKIARLSAVALKRINWSSLGDTATNRCPVALGGPDDTNTTGLSHQLGMKTVQLNEDVPLYPNIVLNIVVYLKGAWVNAGGVVPFLLPTATFFGEGQVSGA